MANKKTLQDFANDYGISLSTAKRYKKAGVDLEDSAAVQAQILSSDSKRAAKSKGHTPENADRLQAADILFKESRAAEKAIIVQKLEGELIDLADIEDDLANVGAILSSELKNLATQGCFDFSSKSVEELQKLFPKRVNEVLQKISDKIGSIRAEAKDKNIKQEIAAETRRIAKGGFE